MTFRSPYSSFVFLISQLFKYYFHTVVLYHFTITVAEFPIDIEANALILFIRAYLRLSFELSMKRLHSSRLQSLHGSHKAFLIITIHKIIMLKNGSKSFCRINHFTLPNKKISSEPTVHLPGYNTSSPHSHHYYQFKEMNAAGGKLSVCDTGRIVDLYKRCDHGEDRYIKHDHGEARYIKHKILAVIIMICI